MAGSWLIASVHTVLMRAMSSTILALYGISSLAQTPFLPCWLNLYFDGATGSRFHALPTPTRMLDSRFANGFPGRVGQTPRALTVTGRNGIPAGATGLRVRGYDEDWVFDDKLGEARTDAEGRFEISYSEVQFRDLEETLPDVYIRIYDPTGKVLLYSSESAVRRNAMVLERFDVEIPRAKLGR